VCLVSSCGILVVVCGGRGSFHGGCVLCAIVLTSCVVVPSDLFFVLLLLSLLVLPVGFY